jgi:hypothetical protein
MPDLDPSAVGASFTSTNLASMQAATLQSATASAPNLYGGQAQPTSSFGADLAAAGQSSATGYTQGANANATSSLYGDQGATNALDQDGDTHNQFKFSYEQNGVEAP